MPTNAPTRIMVVDDDPVTLHLLQATIEACFGKTVSVEAIDNPAEARTRLEAKVVDLLLTDLQMPDLNGLQLLRCAKRRNAWTQVVLITGHSDHEAMADAMDMGATDYLVKPVDPAELEEVIRAIQRRLRRWRRALASTLAH